MRSVFLFVSGTVVGIGAQGIHDNAQGDIVSLNHVAIGVSDFEGASDFYREVMGFPEALAFRETDGSPVFSYFQINRSTFIELMPTKADRPAGFVHVGLEVANLDALVARLRAGGMELSEPIVSPRTGARISVARTPDGTTVELLELGPDSMQRKKMDAWK